MKADSDSNVVVKAENSQFSRQRVPAVKAPPSPDEKMYVLKPCPVTTNPPLSPPIA